MKWWARLLLMVAVALAWGGRASAHLPGQEPFFRVNGQYPNFYSIPINPAISQFTLPQSQPIENYSAGQTLSFKIDTNFLRDSQAVIDATIYTVKFGDNTQADGIIHQHTYKAGSYIVEVWSNYQGKARLIEAVLIHVLPNANYQLPKAVIKANGRAPFENDSLDFNGALPVELSGSASVAGSSPIVSYQWDFGDHSGSTESDPKHKFQTDQIKFFSPVLRVTDRQGFISEAVVNLNEAGADAPRPPGQGNWLTTNYKKINHNLRSMIQDAFGLHRHNWGLAGLVLLLAALAGSLHSITPGHGKSLMAALLIGKDRSKLIDVLILAGAITLTHTSVIFGIGFVFLVLDKKYSVTSLMPHFEKFSALLILALAIGLIVSGWRKLRHQRQHGNSQPHHHDHGHSHSHDHAPKRKLNSKWGLFLAGASGGLIPCVDALSLMLLAISLGQVAFGLILVLSFSLGLACSIVLLGFLVLTGKNRIKTDSRLGRFAESYAPILSGAFILVLALKLLL